MSGFLFRVTRDCLNVLLRIPVAAEITEARGLHARVDRMDVCVLEGGQHRPAIQLDHVGVWRNKSLHTPFGPHVGQDSIANRERACPRSSRVLRIDRAAAKHEIGCNYRLRSRRSANRRRLALAGQDQRRADEHQLSHPQLLGRHCC